MAQNPIDAALGGAPPTPTPPADTGAPVSTPAPSSSSNPIDSALSGHTPSANPIDNALGGGGASTGGGEPDQDTTVGQRFKQAWNDPSKGVLGHIWGVLNTPTVDVDSALGRSGQAGGIEKGANDLVSGLTSPLSIALTVGTFGLGGLIEAGGAAALKAVGMAAGDISEVTKGAQVVQDAVKAGKTFQEGMQAAEAAGVNPQTLTKGLQTLKDASLDPSSLLSKGLARNTGTAIASKFGLSAKAADTVGQGLQFLTAAGMTLQQAQQAAELSPRVLDALKDGDYSTAERLGIDALGSAAIGGLAAHEVASESGGLMSDVAAKVGLKVKPSAENLEISKNFGQYDKNVTTAGRTADLWAQDLRKAYPKMDPTQLERVRYFVEAGMDPDVLAQRHNALAEAAGRDVRVPENGIRAYHGTPANFQGVPRTDGLGAHFTPSREVAEAFREGSEAGRVIEANLSIRNPLRVEDHQGSHTDAGSTIESFVKQGVLPKETFNQEAVTDRVMNRHAELLEASGEKGNALTDEWRKANSEAWTKANNEELERAKQYIKSQGYDGLVYKNRGKGEGGGDSYVTFDPAQIRPAQQGPISSGFTPDRLREVIEQKNLAARYKPEEVSNLLSAYDPTKLTDADKELAGKIRDQFNDTLQYAQQNDALGEGVKNYATSIWKKGEENNPATNLLTHDASTGAFSTNTSQARARIFDNAFEGQLFGKKLEETDPITLAAHNASTFARVVEARKAVERLADNGTRASDGRPMVTLSGEGHPADDNSVFVNPRGSRSVKVPNKIVQGLKDSGDLDRLVKEGKIHNLTRTITPDNLPQAIDRLEHSMIAAQPKFDAEGNSIMLKSIQTLKDVRDGKLPRSALDAINAQRPDVYGWDDHDYSVVDHPAMKAWNHVAQSPSGDNVIMKADMKVHPEAKEYLERRLGVDSQGIGDSAIGKGLAKVNKETKGLTLSLSPFHIGQIGLRGVMSGVSPFRIERWDLANDPVLAKGVEHGLTLGKSYQNRSAFSDGTLEGHSAILDRIPGLRTIQNGMNSFLFDKYIPAVKAATYKELVQRYQEAYPQWTPEKAAEVAADDTNSRYGGLNYKKLGRSAATQNFFKMSALAPDWLESEIRSIARPFGTEGKIARQDLARITAYIWLSARVLNVVTNGQPHLEAPFGVAVPLKNGKQSVISVRSLPSDLLHAVSDPYGFIRGRVSPIGRAASEMYSGTDSFGRKLSHGDLAADMFRNTLPIPTQSIGKSLSGMTPETGNVGQVIGALGGTDTIYRTEAQKLAAKLASDRSESGPVDQAQLARHTQLMSIEDQLRTGQITHQQVQDMYIDGHITQAEKGKIDKNFTQTRGLPADQAQLLIRASRLAAPDLLKLWDAATPTEKVVLSKTMSTAKNKYINKAVKDMTPEQRQNDPTIKRLRTMFVNPQVQ